MLLLSGGYRLYLMLHQQTIATNQFSDMQQRGLAALTLITADLRRSGFRGGLAAYPVSSIQWRYQTLPTGRCGVTLQKPYPDASGWPIPIWVSSKAETSQQLGCLQSGSRSLVENSQTLSLITLADWARVGTSNRVWLLESPASALLGSGSAAALESGQALWQYRHRWYFIASQEGMPSLRRYALYASGIRGQSSGVSIRGIALMRVSLGLRTAQQAVISEWKSRAAMASGDWAKIIAVQIAILVRALEPQSQYVNERRYWLADRWVGPFDDHYRRLVMSQIVWLANMER